MAIGSCHRNYYLSEGINLLRMGSQRDGDQDARLFIVEDEEDVANMYVNWLRDDYDVAVAYTGADAIDRIDGSVDLVLLDRRMPGVSGDEVLEWIRAEGIDCYVVMITAVDPDLSIVEMEFQEYLVKPISSEELHETVQAMLDQKRQEERIRDLFYISSRLTTLESKLDLHQLQQSEKYQELQEELEVLWMEFEQYFEEEEFAHSATVEKIQSVFTSTASRAQH